VDRRVQRFPPLYFAGGWGFEEQNLSGKDIYMGANGRVICFNLLGGTGRGRGKNRLECTFLEIFFSYGNEMAHFSILCSNQLSYLDRVILFTNQPFSPPGKGRF
jgi:hypothetical protein